MSTDIRFGTDGWRAVIARDFTFDNVRIVAQAIADYINSTSMLTMRPRPRAQSPVSKGQPRIVVGYDRRFMSDIYADIISRVLAANNIRVLLTSAPTPTPAVSFAIKTKALAGGVIVTASHNPPVFNGIKFKTLLANSADREITAAIERLLGKTAPRSIGMDQARKTGRVEAIDAGVDYVDFLKRYVDISKIKRSGNRILVDCMYGSGIGYMEAVLGKSEHLMSIRCAADPLFGGISPEPIPRNLAYPSSYIRNNKFDLCVALDGDADRIGALRPDGKFITSGQIISLILLHFLRHRGLTGDVVKTISGTTLIEKICSKHNLTLFETPVGFKYISALMLKENILIGGEESGGIGFCGYIPERDGILSALLLMEMLAYSRKGIGHIMKDMDREYGSFCYDRVDMHYPVKKAAALIKGIEHDPPNIVAGKKISKLKTYDGIKFIFKDSSWLLLRSSGTEPVIRIYAEAASRKEVRRLLSAGKRIIRY
jgi:alpha-D-glucose phosphate-specific phosphoglucomutase